MRIESNAKMPLVTVEKDTLLLCFDEMEFSRESVVMYQYESVRVWKTSTYNDIASAIILDRYPINEQLAIFTHLGDGDTNHEKEHEDFRAWCEHAKSIAHKIVG